MSYRSYSRKVRAALLGSVVALSAVAGPRPAHAEGQVPYADAGAKGLVSLCDRAGKPIRGGGVGDKPFAWTAVSSDRAPAPYNGPTRTATLFAFQPRKDVPPEDWSGSMLTASSKYTNTAHPMAQATDIDWSLADFLSVYPATWEGLVQLRIYLGAADRPIMEQGYASADLRVTGDRWEVVQGGDAPCNSGKAVSLETSLLPADFFSPDPSRPDAAAGSAGSSSSSGDPGAAGSGNGAATGPAGPGGSAGQGPAAGGGAGASSGGKDPATAGQSSRTSATGRPGEGPRSSGWTGAAVAGLGLLAAAGALFLRARSRGRSAGEVGQ